MSFLEFAGQHPFVTVICLALLVHMPVAIIQALKNTKSND